eukprot:TRINITY_DN2487_c2_g1_i2.p1 TRINITY_DN2487_c2_g1~~TRINITY_DN2487_c2_g1_i2.p1  ORF type:complete len:187 (-),score=71.06 TRINITY_DN2487_c2_g1_i2:45-605(-)
MRALSLYDKQMGYCQSMSFIAAPLLLHMPEEDVFYVMVRLCELYDMRGVFMPGFPNLHKWLFVHDQLLDTQLSRLSMHLKNEMVPSSSYATLWYSSLFANALPFSHVMRIWDWYFLEGKRIIFSVAMAILKLLMPELLKSSFDVIVIKLRDLSNFPFTPDQLITTASEFKLSNRIQRLEATHDEQK